MGIAVKLKGKTEAELVAENPTLLDRQLCFATDKSNFKVGPGEWNSLDYWINAGTPQPARYFISEADLNTQLDPESEDRYPGEYAFVQGTEVVTIYTWNPTTEEWGDTTQVVSFIVKQSVTAGDTDAVSGEAVYQHGQAFALTSHTHSTAESWLSDIVNALVASDNLLAMMNARLSQGPGINLTIEDGKIKITNTGDGEAGIGDFEGIGGDPLDNDALATEFGKYLKKYVWKTSSLVGTTRTFDFDNAPNPIFEISPTTENESWVFTNVPTDLTTAIQLQVVVNYAGITEFTAGLPALSGGAVHKETGTSNTITSMPLPTGKTSGYVSDVFAYRKADGGYNWIFGEGNTSTGTGDVPDWITATPSAGNLALDFDDSPTPFIGYVESGAVTWQTPTNVLADPKAVLATIQVQLASTSHAITLPANFEVKGTSKTSITLTGVSGDIITLNVLKRGTKYEIFYASDAVELAKALVADINTGTDDAKYITSLGLEGSKYLSQYLNKIYAVATGSANTYAVTLSPAVTAYPRVLAVQINVANTGASTINPNGLGAKSITKNGTSAVASGDLPANQIFLLVYDGTQYQVAGSIGSGGGGSGTVTSFSAGDLSPLFTTSEATSTTTPALSFAQVNQAANIIFAGPGSGGSAAPTFRALVLADFANNLITFAKLQTIGANKHLGNVSGGGNIQELDGVELFEAFDSTTTTDTSYSMLATDRNINVTDTTAARTITLINPASVPRNWPIEVLDESDAAGTNNITIVTASGTIRGNALINANGGSRKYKSNGTNRWHLIASS